MSGGIIVAAPASGSGKTLIVAGLLHLLRRRGVRVAAAKVGPDYIDPTFHARAGGVPCVNLDPWAMRPATLAHLVRDLEGAAELVLCEGVMGLFDGAGPDGEAGSTAALAKATGWPVVLVVDTAGQGASVAALAAGFAHHDRDVPLAGIILNRVAGARHLGLLTATLDRRLPEVPVLGAVPRDAALALPSRHLGLVPAGEAAVAAEPAIAAAASLIAEGCALDRLVALARAARAPCPPASGGPPPGFPWGLLPLGRRIAVARDDAFLFCYAAMLAGWRQGGVAVSFFSPLADEPPDPAADAVFLPGGYPELHAARLASASHFRGALREAAAAGKAVYGECGGYMVLGETLTDAGGDTHRMAGLLPLATSFAAPRRHLGYRTARLLAAGPLGAAGARFRGHEFHYAAIVEEGGADPLFAVGDALGNPLGHAGLRRGNVAGSFVHLIDAEA